MTDGDDAGDVRREGDGRPARGKKPKPTGQAVRHEDGRVSYRAQLVHPLTKKRMSVTGETREELAARIDEIRRLRRNLRHGIVTPEQAIQRASEAAGRPERVLDAWMKWRASAGHSRRWAQKVESIWRHHFHPMFGSASLYELTAERMGKWLAWMREKPGARDPVTGKERKLSAKTIVGAFYELTACVRHAIMRSALSELPWRGWQIAISREEANRRLGDTKDAFLSPEEVARAMMVAEGMAQRGWKTSGVLPDLGIRIGVMSFLGLRAGEAVALSWDAIRHERDALHVLVRFAARQGWRRDATGKECMEFGGMLRPCSPPKAGNVRLIPIAPDGPVVRMLRAQLALCKHHGVYHPNGPVFPDAKGQFRARNCVDPAVAREVAIRAGIMRAGLKWDQHSFRHSAARMAVRAGGTLNSVQHLLGHSDAKTTEVYFGEIGVDAKPSAADSARALDAMRLPALEGGPADPALALLDASRPFDQSVAVGTDVAAIVAHVDEDEEERTKRRAWHEKHHGRRIYDVARHVDTESTRVPATVKKTARVAYQAAYARERRAGFDAETCAKAGRVASRGILSAYGAARTVKIQGGRKRKPSSGDGREEVGVDGCALGGAVRDAPIKE